MIGLLLFRILAEGGQVQTLSDVAWSRGLHKDGYSGSGFKEFGGAWWGVFWGFRVEGFRVRGLRASWFKDALLQALRSRV